MSSIPVPDEQTQYSSRRVDDVEALAWPVLSEHALELLRSAGEVSHPQAGELLWDAGDPYDLYLVLSGGVLLLDRRDSRVVIVVEDGDFVGGLGMLMGQRAGLTGVAMEGTSVLRVLTTGSVLPHLGRQSGSTGLRRGETLFPQASARGGGRGPAEY